MYIVITSLFMRKAKKISASSRIKEATAPIWHSYGSKTAIIITYDSYTVNTPRKFSFH